MESIHLKDEFIKLGQALKLAGLVGSGVDAKFVIQDGLVKVNGEVETQRGKKLYPGDTVSYDGKTFKVTKIAKKAFYNCRNLKQITVKATGINKVGKKAFKGTNKQLKIKVPKKKLKAYKKLFGKITVKSK